MAIEFNFPFSLEVSEKYTTKLLGSDIEPYQIGYTCESDTWDNGSTTYCKERNYEWWFIVQNGKAIIIKKVYESGDWAEEKESYWESYECNHLPNGVGIERIES